jgi:hypothetical protein
VWICGRAGEEKEKDARGHNRSLARPRRETIQLSVRRSHREAFAQMGEVRLGRIQAGPDFRVYAFDKYYYGKH